MPQSSKLTVIGVGVCVCHPVPIPMTGMIVTGAATKQIENLLAARITDVMLGFCGHPGIMVTGSSTVTVENQQQCKIGDNFVGCFTGVVVTGAGTHTTV